MGIYSSLSPNDMKHWLIDELKTEITSILTLMKNIVNSPSLTKDEKMNYLSIFHRYFSSATQLLNFAYERQIWTDSVAGFIMSNGEDGLLAYIYLLSTNKPATKENLELALWEIKSRRISEVRFLLSDGYIVVKKSFNDIILERYAQDKGFVSAVTMAFRGEREGEKKDDIRFLLDELRIENTRDKENVSRLCGYVYNYIAGKTTWGAFIKEIRGQTADGM